MLLDVRRLLSSIWFVGPFANPSPVPFAVRHFLHEATRRPRNCVSRTSALLLYCSAHGSGQALTKPLWRSSRDNRADNAHATGSLLPLCVCVCVTPLSTVLCGRAVQPVQAVQPAAHRGGLWQANGQHASLNLCHETIARQLLQSEAFRAKGG